MERYKAIVANNMLKNIEEVEKILKYIQSIEGKRLQIKTEDCPYCIPIPTNPVRDEIYKIIKSSYEDELKDIENRLKKL